MKTLKIDWADVQKHLEEYYEITNFKLMVANGYERDSEHYKYPDYIEGDLKEGFKEIADSFKEIAEVEEQHEKRYRKLLENVKSKKVFKKDKKEFFYSS